jgi:hypothetical protein
MAASASVSLGVAGGMVVPRVLESTTRADVRAAVGDAVPTSAQFPAATSNAPAFGAWGRVVTATDGAVSHGVDAQGRRYAVLAASFPAGEVSRTGILASTPIDAVVGQLQKLGYNVRATSVDLGDSGEWRRVLVGDFATEADARAQADRVRQTPAFAEAQVIRY